MTDQLIIGSVSKDSQAAELGLQSGDVVTSCNGMPVKSLFDVMKQIQGCRDIGRQDYTIEIIRDGHEQSYTLDAASELGINPQADREQKLSENDPLDAATEPEIETSTEESSTKANIYLIFAIISLLISFMRLAHRLGN